MTIGKMKELEELSKPLQEWLYANYDPHHIIIIDSTSTQFVQGICGVPNNEIKNRG